MSLSSWVNTEHFKAMEKKTTQLELYIKKNSSAEILQLVSMANKVFGTEMEGIIREIFHLSPPDSSQHDGKRFSKKIELKSARWHANGLDCNWQHLEPDYDYEFVIFVLVDFDGLKAWIITKDLLMGDLRKNNVVLKQGQQGWTTSKNKLEKYLTPISSVEDLDRFISQNSSESKTSPPQTVSSPSHLQSASLPSEQSQS
jgi:hypothetical protein